MPKDKKKADPCDFCGGDTTEYGTTECPTCGEVKCVASCIPGGEGTECTECEEEEDDDG